MRMRTKTNCNCLFLNKNIIPTAPADDNKNKIGIIFCKVDASLNRSIAKTFFSDEVVHKLNTKISAPDISAATNKYMDCIRWIIF